VSTAATTSWEPRAAVAPVDVVVQGLSKYYTTTDGGWLHALDQVDLTIDPGSVVAVVGPSGCGKSTMLRVTCGLEPATAGEVLVGGRPVRGPRTDVGVAFQNPDLLEWRTVAQNIALGARLQRRNRRATTAIVDELLAVVGLSEFGHRYPHELSGGMQQRAALARALAIEPAVLLLDEPFGALDALTRERLNIELSRLCAARSVTTLLITHSIDEAVFVADRVAVMSARPGRILEVINVDIPKPRAPSCYADPTFVSIARRLREHFLDNGADEP
jgi:NitT/TauT family transport system ATP-binding protein